MEIRLPDVKEIISRIIEVESFFEGEAKKIREWLEGHREKIIENKKLIEHKSDESDIRILLLISGCLLIRAMKGERAIQVHNELQKLIKTKHDLNEDSYRQALERANYRFVDKGTEVISKIVDYFKNTLDWDWGAYFSNAERYHETDFQQDELLRIQNVGLKVRDVALTNFNRNYVANDLHVVRVTTRVGLLNYGFDLLKDDSLEMGNNPANRKNYLFLHKLVHRLSKLTDSEFYPSDFDKIFWHFGKTLCGDKPKCFKCPINDSCLTGRYRK